MPRTPTASELRSTLIKKASSFPQGSEERRAILAKLTKKARKGSLTITVDEDSKRDGQPYVEFVSKGGKDRFYQVKKGTWRNATGQMPPAELATIADWLLAGKL